MGCESKLYSGIQLLVRLQSSAAIIKMQSIILVYNVCILSFFPFFLPSLPPFLLSFFPFLIFVLSVHTGLIPAF